MLSVAVADTAGERLNLLPFTRSDWIYAGSIPAPDSIYFILGADYMKKVILSLLMALTVSFSVVSPVVYASASEPTGEAAKASIGDYIDKADEVVGFLNDFMDVVHNVKDFFANSGDPVGQIKSIVDDMFIGFVSSAVSLLPGGDFINLIAGWLGLYDFSITGYFGSKVQDYCNANQAEMLEFYNDFMLPCYGSVDNFVDDIYGVYYDPAPVNPVLPNGEALSVIGDGAGSFISGVLIPIGEYCVNSEICLSFCAVIFVFLGSRILRRSVGAFVRGR